MDTKDTSSVLVPVEKVDYLDQDPPVRGQNYVCLSFLSPEDVIVRKDSFYFQRFVGAVGQDILNLLNGIAAKFGEDDENVMETINMLKDRHKYLSSPHAMDEEFRFYTEKKEKELSKEFDENNQFRTSMRGIKVRGVYETMPEAMNRIQAIKRTDPNFNVYVAEVGCWCPWSPNPEDIQEAKYAETQLNTLMKSYKDNLSLRDEYYQARKAQLLTAIEDAKKKSAASMVGSVQVDDVELSTTTDVEEAQAKDIVAESDLAALLQEQQPHMVCLDTSGPTSLQVVDGPIELDVEPEIPLAAIEPDIVAI
jgi:hypothetical protein